MHQAEGIDFWIVRQGEDAYKVAPEVADEISEHPNDGVCLYLRRWPQDQRGHRLPLAC